MNLGLNTIKKFLIVQTIGELDAGLYLVLLLKHAVKFLKM
jgi:hypothetical protein